MSILKWGIIGPGNIARRFAQGIAVLEDAEIHAVGSRSVQRAQAFADEYSVPVVYDSYASLIADPDIDIIYVATPHPYHKDIAIACLQGGKPVLCEKPLCVNSEEVAELIQCAQENRVFLMEAMWTRFLPVMNQVRAWIDDGRIGAVRQLKASFGYNAAFNPQSRAYDPDLAGGSLLDVGVYVVALAQWIFEGVPEDIQASAIIGKSNVDEQSAIILRYPEGGMAVLDSSIHVRTDATAYIYGERGHIVIGPDFWCAEKATLHCDGETTECSLPHQGNGFEHEAAAVAACIRAGRGESSVMPHQDSIEVMNIMDRVREIIGLRYPFEKTADS